MNMNMLISDVEAERAVGLLGQYVSERLALLGLPEVDGEPVSDHALDSTLEAIHQMSKLFNLKELIQKRVKTPLERGYDYLRFTIVPKMMEDDDTTSLTVSGVGRVNIMDDVQVKVQDKAALNEWLIEHELEDMITESVNAQTLAAFVRKRVRDAKEAPELPPEAVLTYKPITRAQITRSAG